MEKKPEHRPFDATMVAQSLERVEERVSAKRSAGVEMAVARAGRTPTGARSLPESDKETARLLRKAAGKKSPPSKTHWFYERAWFQAVALSALLAAIGGLVYWVTRPPDPHQLFVKAQILMQTDDWDKQKRAREGPIQAYLKHYADRSDDERQQMVAWADEMDLALRERQLRTRMKRSFQPDDETERTAFAAVRREEAGDLAAARERWQALAPLKESTDADARPWGLVAEKRLADLDAVDQRVQDFQSQVIKSRTGEKEFEPVNHRQARAGRALRFQLFGDLVRAKEEWSTVKSVEGEPDERWLFLLAASKVAELTPKIEADTDPKGVNLVRQKLKEAATLQPKEPDKAALICRDVVFLYEKDSEMADEVSQAKKLLDGLAMPGPKNP